MGDCCSKSQQMKDLEDKLKTIENQKEILERKLKAETENQIAEKMAKQESGKSKIDKLNESPHIEMNDSVATQDIKKNKEGYELVYHESYETTHSTKETQGIADYEEITKLLMDFIRSKHLDFEKRLEIINSVLSNSSEFQEERQKLAKELLELPTAHKSSLFLHVKSLEILDKYEKSLQSIERCFPKLSPSNSSEDSLASLESSLSQVIKSSLSCVKSLDLHIQPSSSISPLSLSTFSLVTQTYPSLFSSLSYALSSLLELNESIDSALHSNPIAELLASLDERLTLYFISSEQHKSSICNKLRRFSRPKSDFSIFMHEMLKHTEVSSRSLLTTAKVLIHKTNKFLETAERQDKIFIEITDRLQLIEKDFEEIDLKVQDFIMEDIKELVKHLSADKSELKKEIEVIKERFSERNEEVTMDLDLRMQGLMEKIKAAKGLRQIRERLKESLNKEISDMKSRFQERISELEEKNSVMLTEKHAMENDLWRVKGTLETTSELAEGLLTKFNSKEIENTSLRNSLAALKEICDQVEEKKNQDQEEIEELRKELRECKKQLRQAENELIELKEPLE